MDRSKSFPIRSRHLVAALLSSLLIGAGCGGETEPGPGTQNPPGTENPGENPPENPPPVDEPDGEKPPIDNPIDPPPEEKPPIDNPPEPPPEMVGEGDLIASREFAPLAKLGLDPANLRPLSELMASFATDPEGRDKLRALMSSFTTSLGVQCTGCHLQGDFGADTPNKRITVAMWDNFVAGLALKTGETLYCDSCHQGQAKFLERSDPEVLSTFMRDSFVGQLERRDGEAHNCATCHGSPFTGNIVDAAASRAP